MINNLSEYFLQEQKFYLNQITYTRLDKCETAEKHTLNCADSIEVEVNENVGVKIIVTRSLYFEPEKLFKLSISFGAELLFEPKMKDAYKWNEINMADEFKMHGGFVTDHLMVRISLLISEITASYGQQPIILPPNIAK